MKFDEIDIQQIPIHQISLNPGNANAMSKKELARLRKEIEENGFLDPVQIVCTDAEAPAYVMVNGEHRLLVAKELGYDRIPAVVLEGEKWDDEIERDLQMVRFGVIHGRLDPEKFAKLYDRVAQRVGPEQAGEAMGFAEQGEVERMIKAVRGDIKKSFPEKEKEFEDKAKKAKTVDDVEKLIRDIMKDDESTLDYGFLVFSVAGKEHIYISMSDRVHRAMDRLMDYAKSSKLDLNGLIEDSIEAAANSIKE